QCGARLARACAGDWHRCGQSNCAVSSSVVRNPWPLRGGMARAIHELLKETLVHSLNAAGFASIIRKRGARWSSSFRLASLGLSMQTLIGACQQCGKEMDIATEFPGMEVRCPHCQQLVLAPVAVPAALPAEATSSNDPAPVARSSDSIFDAPTQGDLSLTAGS